MGSRTCRKGQSQYSQDQRCNELMQFHSGASFLVTGKIPSEYQK